MAPGDLKRGAQIRFAESGEHGDRPALPPPAAGDRRKRLGRQQAFEFLLVGREFEIDGPAIGCERRVNARDAERGAVEMRGLACTFERERNASEIIARGHAFSPIPVTRP